MYNLAQVYHAPVDIVNKIEHVARVSTNNTDPADKEPGRLARYLIKNQHWSPFEMFDVVMYIETTRDIARQLLRHRSFFFQEFSQRYAEVKHAPVYRDARRQDTKNRQNSIDDMSQDDKHEWDLLQAGVVMASRNAYERALEMGIAKEQARAVLPEGMTLSKLYMKGSVRSWIHYCDLRCSHGTQLEHQDLAVKIKKELSLLMPGLFVMDQHELDFLEGKN
jgi:thymidylate synthase (FAD)